LLVWSVIFHSAVGCVLKKTHFFFDVSWFNVTATLIYKPTGQGGSF
jgi:hypothetical protein